MREPASLREHPWPGSRPGERRFGRSTRGAGPRAAAALIVAVAHLAACRATPLRPDAAPRALEVVRPPPPPLVPDGAEAALAARVSQLSSGEAVRACYERELALEPALLGRVTMRFTVGLDGATSDIVAEEDTLGSPIVVRCLTAEIARWTVAPPPLEPTEVATPLVFTPGR